jgi:hypothetical protein
MMIGVLGRATVGRAGTEARARHLRENLHAARLPPHPKPHRYISGTGFKRVARIFGYRTPMPNRFRDDPQTWRDRAEEARSIAELMRDGKAKESMLRIAGDYDELARLAQQRHERATPQ